MAADPLGTVEQAVANAVADAGHMLTRVVVVAEYLDPDGARRLGLRASEELRPWDVAGMLRGASAQVDAELVAMWAPAEDEES